MIKEKKESEKVVAVKNQVAKDAPKAQISVGEGGVKKPSVKKEEFKALIEAYKIQNPVKYEMKKEYLEEQLKSLS